MVKQPKSQPASALVRPPVIVPPEISASLAGGGSVPRPEGAALPPILPPPVPVRPEPIRRCSKCQSTHTKMEDATAEEEHWVCLEPHCGRRFRVRVGYDFGASRRCECGSLETKLRSVGGGMAWRDCLRCGRTWKVVGIRL